MSFELLNHYIDIASQTIIPCIISIMLVLFIADGFSKKKRSKSSHLYNAPKNKAHGIIFGLKKRRVVYSPTASEGHVAVFGGSGLGKTSAILIPTLRSWTGTSFTIDISSDICSNVDMPNKLIYEATNPASTPYNILGPIDNLINEDDKNEALEELAILLMPDDDKMSDASKFYNTEGRKILTASLIAFYHLGLDFITICEKITRNSWKNLFNAIEATKNDKAIQYINSFEGTTEQSCANCKQTADMSIKLFATNERIKKTIRRPHPQEVAYTPSMLEKYNVFVIIEDSQLELLSPLLCIISAQTLKFFSARDNASKTNILFCLDEFASLGHIEITSALRKLRKKHVRIIVLTQSMADIDLIYGHDERMAMMNNFRFKVVLSADDTDTQEYLAKLIGYHEVQKHSTSSNSRQTTHTESEAKEWIIEPAELAHLGNELILLHPDGHSRLAKNFYYR